MKNRLHCRELQAEVSTIPIMYRVRYIIDGRLLAEYNGLGICVRDYIDMGGKLIAEYLPQENSYGVKVRTATRSAHFRDIDICSGPGYPPFCDGKG